MKITHHSLGLLFGLCAVACSNPESRTVESGEDPAAPTAHGDDGHGHDGDDDGEAEEVEVPLDQVPEAVKAAAMAAVPGIVLEEAEMEVENGVTIYDVEGELDGVEYEIEVTADGVVNEIEEESGDDDEEHGDDDDDEHEGGDHDGGDEHEGGDHDGEGHHEDGDGGEHDND